MRAPRLLAILLLVTSAGCGGARLEPDARDPGSAPPTPQPRAAERRAVDVLAPGAAGDSSDFRWNDSIFHFLADDGRVIDTEPWTACLGNGCWDGAPGLGGPIPSVGSPDALYFAFEYPDWRFHWVTFSPVDDECGGRSTTVRARPVTDRVFRIDPAGARGKWRVDVFGRGAAGGDAVTSVLWTTPEDGTVPVPRATGSLFSDQDGTRVAPYGGPELHLADLARTPSSATASWTVTDRSGVSVSIPLRREKSSCERDGTVSFQGREPTPAELDSLSGASVTYTVELSLDGRDHTGTARWPQDETAEAPYSRFTFEPPLPAFGA